MVEFTKYQGTGNDYLFIDGMNAERDWPYLATRMTDRHFGVGADGIIVAVPSIKAPVRMRMFNADGSEGEMCGNGIRCFYKFVVDHGLIQQPDGPLDVETNAGILSIVPKWDGETIVGARVDMGTPILEANRVPVDSTNTAASNYEALNPTLVQELGVEPSAMLFDAAIKVGEERYTGTAVSMGNPHYVSFVDQSVHEVELTKIGPIVEHHRAFPERVNFHIVNIINRAHLVIRTWERGSGITLACGTGASAVVVAARLHGFVDDDVLVTLPGGDLSITWSGNGSVFMEGDAVEVFSGSFPD